MGGNLVGGARNRGSRSLPYHEDVKRREERRYFHYGEAYNPRHRCPKKNLGSLS